MKTLLTSLFFLLIFEGCSFDNKSGIWRNNDNTVVKKVNVFNDFEKLYTEEKNFNLLVNPEPTLNINLSNPKKITEWNDEFYRASNNSENFFYTDTNNIIFKGKKLVSGKINEKFLFDGSNIILADNKGSLVIYSIEQNEIIYNFNFYNKKFKKIKKKLNFIVKDKIIYVSDNIGYLYALDYYNKKILWAKNFKIPFRSNLKIIGLALNKPLVFKFKEGFKLTNHSILLFLLSIE